MDVRSLEVRDPRQGSMLHMLWKAVAAQFEEAAPSSQTVPPSATRPDQRIRRLPLRWSPPKAAHAVLATPAPIVGIAAQQPGVRLGHPDEPSRRHARAS
jgi:hypothetical protein